MSYSDKLNETVDQATKVQSNLSVIFDAKTGVQF
jgi:hypothetical protein